MKKTDFVIFPCKLCQQDCYAVKYQKTYQKTPEFVICMRCLNDL